MSALPLPLRERRVLVDVLLDGDALGQVAGHVGVEAALDGEVVGHFFLTNQPQNSNGLWKPEANGCRIIPAMP